MSDLPLVAGGWTELAWLKEALGTRAAGRSGSYGLCGYVEAKSKQQGERSQPEMHG